MARDAVQELLNQFFDQEAAVYANPQLQFAEDEANSCQRKADSGAEQAGGVQVAASNSRPATAGLSAPAVAHRCRESAARSPRVGCWKPSSGSRR